MDLGPLKTPRNLFLGTFKSYESVENDFYFIFMKSFVFTKMGLEIWEFAIGICVLKLQNTVLRRFGTLRAQTG